MLSFLKRLRLPVNSGHNQLVYLASGLSYTLSSSLCVGGYLQAFLLSSGLTTAQVALFGSVSTACSMLSYFLFTLYRPRGGNYLPMLWLGMLAGALCPLSMVFSALWLRGTAMLLLLLPFHALYNLGICFSSSAEYCSVPRLFSRQEYGSLVTTSGILGSLLALMTSLVVPRLISGGSEMSGYIAIFAVSSTFMLLSALLNSRYRPISGAQSEAQKGGLSLKEIAGRLRNRDFLVKMLPHILRGVFSTGVTCFPLIALSRLELSAAQSGYLVAITTASGLLSTILLLPLLKRFRSGHIILGSVSICVVCLIAVPFVNNVTVFFALYFIMNAAKNAESYGVPIGVMRSTPTAELPLVSSLRMLLYSGSTSLMTLLVGGLLDSYALPVMLVISAVSLLGGLLYARQFTDALAE